MNRVLFTVYIELQDHEIQADTEHYSWDSPRISKSERTRIEFQRNYHRLKNRQSHYAQLCSADYFVIGRDARFNNFRMRFESLSLYQIVNLYKIHLLQHYANMYEQLLYLDFDVVPNSNISIFDAFDFSAGVCVRQQTPVNPDKPYRSERDPVAKIQLTRGLLAMNGINRRPHVINTGIIGIHAGDVRRLNFFGHDFPQLIEATLRLGYSVNNEAFFAYRLCANGLNVQWLSDSWHHIYDSKAVGHLNNEAHMIHVINKRFDDVWTA